MKKLRISRLTLEKFKGVDRLELNLGGANATISGQNGAGKTTVADAYTWLMTGKMSDGRMAEIGCYDSAGKLDTEANHIAEVEFADGTKFRRESNGTAKFYANGVPVKATEYMTAVKAATNGANSFLATPQAFCTMRWQDRRQILMSLVDITDAEIIASAKELQELEPLLAKQSVKDIEATARDQRKKVNAELLTIPARIEELQLALRPVGTVNVDDIGAQIAELERQIIVKGAQIRELQKATHKALELFAEINRLAKLAMEADSDVAKTAQQIECNSAKLDTLRDSWKQTNEAMSGKCPTCGAKVASDRLPEIQRKLDRIAQEGGRLAETQKKLKATLDEDTRKAEKMRTQLADMKAKFEITPDDPVHDQLDKALNERDEIQHNLDKLKIEFAAIEDSEKVAARIAELRQRETELGAQIAELDKQLYLAELYTQQKIKLIEDTINSKFEHVRWRMFESYKSVDGVRECCEPLINGVPYGGNLSKGEKLKAALDVLRTLQSAYEVELPVFIDDAESYTSNSFVGLPNQVIRLVVVEGVKELKINVDSKEPVVQQAQQSAQISLFEEEATA